ncbi:hypothetical protein Tco_0477407 [Tanacetum coccineum]
MTGNKSLFSTYKAYDRVEESLNVIFDESPPPTKLSPLVDDDVGEEEAIRNNTKVVNNNNEEDVSIEVDEIVNIKESKNHPLVHQEDVKKFGLEDSKPTKTPMSMEIKLTKDDEADSVDSSKYRENPKTTHLESIKRIFRYIRGTTHLGLWYPKGTGVGTIVYADSNHAGDYVDRKSTSGVYTFMGCCLISWFIKKQMALSISTTEAEYVSTGKSYKFRINGTCVFSKECSLELLNTIREKHVPYQTNLPNIRDVVQDIYIPSSHQNYSNPTIILRDNLPPNIKDWELIVRKNVICVDTHKTSLDACSTIMLYNLKNSHDFNLADFIAHKIESVKNRVDCPLPYGLLITRLYRFILAKHPELFRPHHTLQFVMHYRIMNSINGKMGK